MRLSYTVSTSPFVDEDGKAIPGALTVTVTCLAQDRVVGGWTEEYTSYHRTRAILGQITDLLVELEPQARRATVRPARPRAEPRVAAAAAPEPAVETTPEDEKQPAGDGGVDAGPPETEVTP
jgi:hypothetical protein